LYTKLIFICLRTLISHAFLRFTLTSKSFQIYSKIINKFPDKVLYHIAD